MRTIVTKEGDVVDRIALKAYSRTAGATEAILAANPALAGLGAQLPAGLVIQLPEIETATIAPTVRLWD
ncbi:MULTISPECIES: tail protein X [Brevundimonas]|jgi:phage tail protein X|uniref:tail protein X n=1 Tax=Brevundimonas sp. TaxID=1871086 RepID=UPI0025BFACE7|nr:tail protein X [Brevundimonas sp.]MCG2663346.1 tail protein X [Brevundimonas sp.]